MDSFDQEDWLFDFEQLPTVHPGTVVSTKRELVLDSSASTTGNKRKRPAAIVSKIAREKRKRERENLKIENDQLKAEKLQFMERITKLQQRVNDMMSIGLVDLHVENELLQSQLQEYKKFIAQLTSIAKNTPHRNISTNTICNQGIDYIASHVLSILASSSWNRVHLTEEQKRLLPGLSASFRFVEQPNKSRRFNLRLEYDLDTTSAKACEYLYSLWSAEGSLKDFLGCNSRDVLIRFKEMQKPRIDDGKTKREYVGAGYARNTYDGKATDYVYSTCRRQQEISSNFLTKSETNVPLNCEVLFRSSTTHREVMEQNEDVNIMEQVYKKKLHKMDSLMMDGYIFWDKTDEPNKCSGVAIISVPEEYESKWLEGLAGKSEKDYCITTSMFHSISSFVNICNNKSSTVDISNMQLGETEQGL